jgi:uncharacterized protein YggE
MKKLSTLLPLLCLLIPGVSLADRDGDDAARTVVVSGAGEIEVQPDKATVSMGVQALKPELDEAREQVISAVASFLGITRELGIEDKDVQSSQLTVRPEYRWNPKNQQQHLIGYFVERQLNVELRNLDKLGRLMEKAVSAGVNVVSGPQFGSSRENALRRQALKRGAQDARASGKILAETLGARLGRCARSPLAASDISRRRCLMRWQTPKWRA